MEKRVLLIGKSKSFMASAISKGLEKEGYEVVKSEPNKDFIGNLMDKPDIYILYLGDEIAENPVFLSYMNDAIVDDGFRLYLIGNTEELDLAQQYISPTFITETYLRPIDVKDLAEHLDTVVKNAAISDEQKKKILIVDDDVTMLRMIKTWLSVKYRVYMASSGKIAVNFLAENKVDLVLLDYEMPMMNGADIFKLMKAGIRTKNIPVMFLTAKGDKESVMKVASLKPEKYLLKTMPKSQLIQAIDEFFEK